MPQDHFGEDVAAKYDEESRAMFAPDVLGPTIDQLKRKDGAQRVNVSIGDMAATRIEGGFASESTSHVSVWQKTIGHEV